MQLCEVVISSHNLAVGEGTNTESFKLQNTQFHKSLNEFIKDKKVKELKNQTDQIMIRNQKIEPDPDEN